MEEMALRRPERPHVPTLARNTIVALPKKGLNGHKKENMDVLEDPAWPWANATLVAALVV